MLTIDLPPVSTARPSIAIAQDPSILEFDEPPRQVLVPPGEPLPRTKARCADGAGTLTSLFFSEDLIDIARAKAICSKCSLRSACLLQALERGEAFGVWGGELLSFGEIVLQKRPRGRPPKHPRPELSVEEVPLPDWAA